MNKELKLKKQQDIKKTILNAAKEIVSKEGIESVSIRKITNKIGYSPGSIYHYFKNKDEIIELLLSEGYQKIISSIKLVKNNDDKPDKVIKNFFVNYIKSILKSPEEYKAFMLSDNPYVLKKTSVLQKGISDKSHSMKSLKETIQRGIDNGYFRYSDAELTAQIIWTSTFGLIIKLIIEKNISEEQVERLIENHFKILFDGIILKEE